MQKLGILNTSILTADGVFRLSTISLARAKALVQYAEIDSAVGHQSTADIMSQLLGVPIPVNRQEFKQAIGQKALVFKLNARAPEGRILDIDEIAEIGYTFKLLERL